MANQLPYPPRKFLIGNLHQIAGKDTMSKMLKMGKDYGPIFEIKILNIPIVFVTNFEYGKELMDEERFPKIIDGPVFELRTIAKDGLFTAFSEEPNWKKAHNILIPGFAQRSIRGYVPSLEGICNQLLDKWGNIPEGEYFNLSDDMTRLTFEAIGICGFDYSFGCFDNEEQHPFIDAMLYALDESVLRARVPPFVKPFRFKRNKEFNTKMAYANGLIDDIIKKRKGDPTAYTSKFDLMSLMLNARDKDSNSKLSDENIRYQIFTFLVAGHETTSGLLSFTFYFLIKNPDWLAKVYEEIDSVLGADLNKKIHQKEVARFQIIKQVLLETLRLYPPVAALNVAPTEATTIGKEKYPLPAKMSCLVWTYHLHRDPKVWGKDAEKFNPAHFAPENIAKRDKDAFKAFGNGKRACIGRQFALTEATLAVAKILQQYKLALSPDYEFALNETITLRPVDLMVKLEKRTDADRYHLRPQEIAFEKAEEVSHILEHDTPFLVLYGSNMGSSEELATKIAKDANQHGFRTTLAPLDDYVDKLPEEGLVQIITSTYNGTPPDNAKKFEAWIKETKADMGDVQYSVFGCGNTQWDTYQLFPNLIDRTLKRLGGTRFYAKGSADASMDFEADFDKWYAHYWATIVKQLGLGKKDYLGSIQIIKKVANYQTPIGGKYTNGALLRTLVCERFGLDANHFVVREERKPILIKDLLEQEANLQGIATLEQLEVLVKATDCPPEKIKLQQYFNQHKELVVAAEKTVLDLLQEFDACEISFATFLDLVVD